MRQFARLDEQAVLYAAFEYDLSSLPRNSAHCARTRVPRRSQFSASASAASLRAVAFRSLHELDDRVLKELPEAFLELQHSDAGKTSTRASVLASPGHSLLGCPLT